MEKKLFVTFMLASALTVPVAASAQTRSSASSPAVSGRSSTSAVEYSNQRARMGESTSQEKEATSLLRDSTNVYRRLVTDSTIEKRREIARKAECVAVFPNIVQAALVVGGKGGQGVASCKGPGNSWSNVTFLKMMGASLGAQLGGRSTELVMFFMNDRAKQALINGETTLGADLSVTYGEGEKALSADTAGDVVAFSDVSGIFAGASFTGTRISSNESRIEQFYGQKQPQKAILTTFGTTKQPQAAESFLQLLPSGTSAKS